MPEVVSVNISAKKGVIKEPQSEVILKVDHGVVGDAHARGGKRQVSMLAVESINRQKKIFEKLKENPTQLNCPKNHGAMLELKPGCYAENITTEGIVLHTLPLGTKITIGDQIEVEVSKIGKECHTGCAIFQILGSCVMPTEGIFVRVVKGGKTKAGDEIKIV